MNSKACVKPSVNASCKVGSADVSGSLIHASNRSRMFVFMGCKISARARGVLGTLRVDPIPRPTFSAAVLATLGVAAALMG